MKWVIPREHGAWMMWIGPLVIGIAATPWNPLQILLAGASLFAFMTAEPFLQGLRQPGRRGYWWRWAAGYGVVAAAFGVPLLVAEPRLGFVVLGAGVSLAANSAFALVRQDRHLLNDFLAMAGLALTGIAAYLVGRGSVDVRAWTFWALCVVYFFGTALYVKSLIRERRNRRLKWAANAYSTLLVFAALALGWTAAVACLPAAVRGWAIAQDRPPKVKTIGILEIGLSVWFVMWMSVWLRNFGGV
ncbi:YwiC-like family protein [Kyrpidia sp.]|uniref:YwiC-like family protein n=1 Tax=Kyrpidia sp. TaxID=2073077 RepID=UPI002588B0BB|nr:YwiC-like family protein [Kyrpidia sp.]MCL6575291.1 YwiC-like family protein [Kyrpidia sp.]